MLSTDSLINEAHKQNKPEKAFSQLYEYSKALDMANMMVNEADTLILSTTDVGSTLSISGYAVNIYFCDKFLSICNIIFLLLQGTWFKNIFIGW